MGKKCFNLWKRTISSLCSKMEAKQTFTVHSTWWNDWSIRQIAGRHPKNNGKIPKIRRIEWRKGERKTQFWIARRSNRRDQQIIQCINQPQVPRWHKVYDTSSRKVQLRLKRLWRITKLKLKGDNKAKCRNCRIGDH